MNKEFCFTETSPLLDLKKAYAKKVEQQWSLTFTGEGSRGIQQVEALNLHFRSQRKMNVEQVRQMYVPIVNGFLSQINADETIRDRLAQYPFTTENVNVTIAFYNEQEQLYSGGSVSMVNMNNSRISYYTFNPNVNWNQILQEESFQEATAISRK